MTRRSGRRVPPGWGAIRRMALERSGWRCRACGRAGKLEADHIVPVHVSPELELSIDNIQILCRGCHIAKTRREAGKPPTPERLAWLRLVVQKSLVDIDRFYTDEAHQRSQPSAGTWAGAIKVYRGHGSASSPRLTGIVISPHASSQSTAATSPSLARLTIPLSASS